MQNDAAAASVLVVSSDRSSADGLVAALVLAGYSASPAYGGAAAIRALEVTRRDLVLVDINSTAADGLVTARVIREFDAHKQRRYKGYECSA